MARFKSYIKFLMDGALAIYAWLCLKLNGKPTLLIFTYHRVLPEYDPERTTEQPGMIVSPESLSGHIRFAERLGAQIMSLEDWVARKQSGGSLPRLSVAFTFDDGWKDNFDHAFPVLQNRRTPATIFLVTNLIGSNRGFWPEQIIKLVTSHGALDLGNSSFNRLRPYLEATAIKQRALSTEEADQLVGRLKALHDEEIVQSLDEIYQAEPSLQPPPQRFILNEDELRYMEASGHIHYGAHTRNHYRLNKIESEAALTEEIAGCAEDLRRLALKPGVLFCYPNGDTSELGEALVAEHYSGACTTQTGWNRANCDAFQLKRFNLHDGNSGSNRTLLATIGRGLIR